MYNQLLFKEAKAFLACRLEKKKWFVWVFINGPDDIVNHIHYRIAVLKIVTDF